MVYKQKFSCVIAFMNAIVHEVGRSLIMAKVIPTGVFQTLCHFMKSHFYQLLHSSKSLKQNHSLLYSFHFLPMVINSDTRTLCPGIGIYGHPSVCDYYTLCGPRTYKFCVCPKGYRFDVRKTMCVRRTANDKC